MQLIAKGCDQLPRELAYAGLLYSPQDVHKIDVDGTLNNAAVSCIMGQVHDVAL